MKKLQQQAVVSFSFGPWVGAKSVPILPHLLAVSSAMSIFDRVKDRVGRGWDKCRCRQGGTDTCSERDASLSQALCATLHSGGHIEEETKLQICTTRVERTAAACAEALAESWRGAAGCSDALSKIVRAHFCTTMPQKTTRAKQTYIDLERCLSHTAGLDEDCYHIPKKLQCFVASKRTMNQRKVLQWSNKSRPFSLWANVIANKTHRLLFGIPPKAG